MSRLTRAEFFGHEKILKLSSNIVKKTREGINCINIRESELKQLLIDNSDWLDYVGIIVIIKDTKSITIRWEIPE